jgi:uncharacterized protein YsxB (DUF464 family)
MTTVTFYKQDELYRGFSASGHAGQADYGEDIVCAAVSAAVTLTECQLSDVMKLSPTVDVSSVDTSISVTFSVPNKAAQPAITALFMYLTQLSGEYPRFLKTLEV